MPQPSNLLAHHFSSHQLIQHTKPAGKNTNRPYRLHHLSTTAFTADGVGCTHRSTTHFLHNLCANDTSSFCLGHKLAGSSSLSASPAATKAPYPTWTLPLPSVNRSASNPSWLCRCAASLGGTARNRPNRGEESFGRTRDSVPCVNWKTLAMAVGHRRAQTREGWLCWSRSSCRLYKHDNVMLRN